MAYLNHYTAMTTRWGQNSPRYSPYALIGYNGWAFHNKGM